MGIHYVYIKIENTPFNSLTETSLYFQCFQGFDKFTLTNLCARQTHKGWRGIVVNRAQTSLRGESL